MDTKITTSAASEIRPAVGWPLGPPAPPVDQHTELSEMLAEDESRLAAQPPAGSADDESQRGQQRSPEPHHTVDEDDLFDCSGGVVDMLPSGPTQRVHGARSQQHHTAPARRPQRTAVSLSCSPAEFRQFLANNPQLGEEQILSLRRARRKVLNRKYQQEKRARKAAAMTKGPAASPSSSHGAHAHFASQVLSLAKACISNNEERSVFLRGLERLVAEQEQEQAGL
jgi:hypothetical protein